MNPDKRPKKRFLPFGNPLSLRRTESRRPLPRSGTSLSTGNRKPKNLWERLTFKGKRRFKFTWKKLFISLGVVVVVLVIGAAGIFAYYAPQLPNPQKIVSRPIDQSTQILDRNGAVLYSVHGDENRTIVTGDQISPFVKNATVSVEDATFYTNDGFDIKGILRAVAVRLHLLHNELGGGGSTISQQYVKNALLSNTNGTVDETITRKLKELILSIEVNQNYSKDDILTGYLNQIPYGNSTYGIQSAAEAYFGVSAKDVTLSQAATLAAIPNAPTYYSPYGDNLPDLFTRKDYILDRMVANGYITKDQATAAKAAAPTLANPNFKEQSDNLVAPHFVFYVEQALIKYLGGDPATAQQELDTGGYTVTTSLDLSTQNMAQQVLSTMGPGVVKNYHATNACLTAVDPKTGQILAMVGSIDYSNSISGNTNFCAADLQPGSSFKPFVYATAWSQPNTYSPSSITYDLKTDFGGGYSPNDYDLKNRGPITDRDALAGSLNIPAVKNLALVGVQNAMNTASNLGINTLTDPASSYGLSLVLGSGSVEPVQMADAYATFANNGMYTPLEPILQIKQNGKVIKDFTTESNSKKELDPDVAYEISNVLSDASAKQPIFGSLTKNLTLPDRPVASKTGTTENFRDGWTIGYTPSIVTAVWVGNNNPNQTMTNGSDGSIVAAPLWNKFMSEYLQGKPVEQFTKPSDIQTLTVDKLSGKLPNDQTPDDDKITDIFAPWQVPKDFDNVHLKVNIDSVSGKLATPLTPAADVVSKTFFVVHSEMPNNPNWENPVQAWALANGGGTLPPTDSDDIHTQANAPTLSFTSPADGVTATGSTIHIEVAPGGVRPITEVDFTLNGTAIGSRTSAPWALDQPLAGLTTGTQTIVATVTNDLGLTASDQVTFQIVADTTPPGPVNGISASDGKIVPAKPITLNWTNPADLDLASVNIYESTTSSSTDLGSRIKTLAATPNSAGTTTIDSTGLLPNTPYYFVIRSVDAAGNENPSTAKISAMFKP